MSQFYISHEGQQIGPMSLTEIVDGVRKNKLSLLDYVYDDGKGDWVLLMEYPAVAQQLKDHKPAPPPKKMPPQQAGPEATAPEAALVADKVNEAKARGEPLNEHAISEWYVLKGENKFGPFAFNDVVKMLQQKVVFEFDFVWHPGMASWKRIAELASFNADSIRKLQTANMPDIQEVFFRRRHRRMNYNGTILVHDNKTVWKGGGMEISAGGAGVVMENAMIVPGQTLYLHFKPCDGVPPFNAVCEVVSKQFVEGVREKNAPIRYGLKFTSISANTQQFLHELARKAEAA
ncbi:MAG: GYF domain-containing protein [Bdellovibrionales bacterium]